MLYSEFFVVTGKMKVVNYCINMRNFEENDILMYNILSVTFHIQVTDLFCPTSIVNLVDICMEFIKYFNIFNCLTVPFNKLLICEFITQWLTENFFPNCSYEYLLKGDSGEYP